MSGAPLLVTGFGPFPGMPDNPSAALARRIAASPRLRAVLGRPARVLVLRTAYSALPEMLAPALAQEPAAVLMIGVAGRSRCPRVEDCARGRASRLRPDTSGRVAVPEPSAAPPLLRSRGAARALACLRRHGIAVRASHDAGRYLCDAAYHRALCANPDALFVHVPPVPRTRRPLGARPARAAAPLLARALAEVAVGLVLRARRS